MTARIFSPSKNPMQSGKGKSGLWVFEYERESARSVEPLMGWTSSSDMNAQIRLKFETLEEAVSYAERNGIAYQVQKPNERMPRPASYADNFRFGRTQNWTH